MKHPQPAAIASFLGGDLFCVVWAILASLREHLTCRCLHIVHSLLVTFGYRVW